VRVREFLRRSLVQIAFDVGECEEASIQMFLEAGDPRSEEGELGLNRELPFGD
jgi:hypothetical protein